ncbi:MAG TPA: acyltransferase [Baekduia sp.]|nr:acyltransferase [Baekduia sp.]
MGASTVNAAEPAVLPPPGNPRFAPVDGLRAFAALAIVLTHTAFISGFNGHGFPGAVTARLDVGVPLFFVISGFLLYRPFVAARLHGRSGPRVRRYARRRALRILPAYWLALTVLAIWPGLEGVHSGDWWRYYLLVNDLTVAHVHGGIAAAWSLCVEVQFYVLLPVYALLLARLLRGRAVRTQIQVELVVLALLGGASIAARWISFADPSPDTVSSTSAGTFLWFTLGMGLALASARWHDVPVGERPAVLRLLVRRPLISWALGAAALVACTQIGMPVLDLNGYDLSDWIVGYVLYGLVALFTAAPIMLGVDGTGGVPERLLTWRPIAWVGLISYGIFLWHHPLTGKFISVQDWTTHGSFVIYTLVVLAVATTCAAISYYAVERPLLRFKDPKRPEQQPSATEAERVELAGAA